MNVLFDGVRPKVSSEVRRLRSLVSRQRAAALKVWR